jgi:hypothetical protein
MFAYLYIQTLSAYSRKNYWSGQIRIILFCYCLGKQFQDFLNSYRVCE